MVDDEQDQFAMLAVALYCTKKRKRGNKKVDKVMETVWTWPIPVANRVGFVTISEWMTSAVSFSMVPQSCVFSGGTVLKSKNFVATTGFWVDQILHYRINRWGKKILGSIKKLALPTALGRIIANWLNYFVVCTPPKDRESLPNTVKIG